MNPSFLFNIFSRISLIALAAFAVGWSFFSGHSPLVGVLLIPLIIYLIINLMNYQNRINERINYFFEAIRNEDFSLAFPSKKNDRIINDLNRNLSGINQYIQQIKIDSNRQEQYFRALIEHVGTGILSYNEKGFVLHANRGLKKMLGMQQFTHLKQLEKIDEKLAAAIGQIQPNDQKLIRFTGKQGSTTLLIKSGAFINQGERLTLLSIQDINQELDEKELDSWLKLIRVLTHEIMNSIAPVTSLSESLGSYFQKEGKAISPDEVNEKMISNTIRGLEIIREQGKGLINFVDSYRKFTRLPKPDKKLISVNELLEKTALLWQTELSSRKLKITVRLTDKKLYILADEKLISQVLINLLKNAVEALADRKDAAIELFAFENSRSQIELVVKDNGPGIPPELMEEIFVPFFTTKESGSGIGLSISRQIMRLHGGSLIAKSVPGKETRFSMLFN